MQARFTTVSLVALWSFSLFRVRASADERVRMALSVRNVVFLPFYYAKDTKIFDKHGLNVELIQMRSDLQLAGLASGEIDFTPSVGPAGAAIANGLPVKALAILYRAPLFSLVSPAGVSSAKDLEGKTVAVSRIGSESHRYGSLILESGGADPKKVTFIQTGSTTVSLTAIQQGSVSAAVLSPPFTGNHGGERVQDPRAKPISAGGRAVARSGRQSAKARTPARTGKQHTALDARRDRPSSGVKSRRLFLTSKKTLK